MKPLEWEVQVTRNGIQVPTFILPELLGLTSARSACLQAMAVLGARDDRSLDVHGVVMNSEYECFDIRTHERIG